MQSSSEKSPLKPALGMLKSPSLAELGDLGESMHAMATKLYPLCRSITGEGLRETLRMIGERIPLEYTNIPSGTQAFDWTLPKEWTIREAWIKDPTGKKVIDFKDFNLHVVGYSTPIHTQLSLSDLRPHLHSIPDQPDWIPYRNSFYKEAWGFCLSQNHLDSLEEGQYEICIDSDLHDGHLSYAECFLPGSSSEEVLISTHVCHPSLANDNLSGIVVATELARHLASIDHRLSYRFLFIPSIIGSIAWLWKNENKLSNIHHGLTLALLGDSGFSNYKRSRRGNAAIDIAVEHVLKHSGQNYEIRDFAPWGYDERQYCSPGFNLPVGCFTRTPNGCFPEYHTSGDNLDFIKAEALADSLQKCMDVFKILEGNQSYVNTSPKGEPRLGHRVAYKGFTGKGGLARDDFSLLWVLNQSDGTKSLLDIAERAAYPFAAIRDAANALEACGLLKLKEEV